MRLDGRSRGSIRSRVLESVDDQDLHHFPPRIQLQSKLLLKGRKDRGEVRVTRWRRRSGARSLLLGAHLRSMSYRPSRSVRSTTTRFRYGARYGVNWLNGMPRIDRYPRPLLMFAHGCGLRSTAGSGQSVGRSPAPSGPSRLARSSTKMDNSRISRCVVSLNDPPEAIAASSGSRRWARPVRWPLWPRCRSDPSRATSGHPRSDRPAAEMRCG